MHFGWLISCLVISCMGLFRLMKNKQAFIGGCILALIDFVLISAPYIYWCASGANRCGEFALAAIVHLPLYAVTAPIQLGNMPLDVTLFTLTGLVQYFVVGYLLVSLIQWILSKASKEASPTLGLKIFISALVLLGLLVFILARSGNSADDLEYNVVLDSDSYQEHQFDLGPGQGSEPDGGYTHRVYEEIKKSGGLLDAGTPILADGQDMTYVELTADDNQEGIVARRTVGDDVYELSGNGGGGVGDHFVMRKNGEPLFERSMEYGAEGPVIDWRVVNGEPAFTVRLTNGNIPAGATTAAAAHTDIYYNGKFIEQEYGVKNPRYLFSYAGKLGFIATDESGDRVFFDGRFISIAFDSIHTMNCCSYNEILPTVFENGTLLFYGKRDSQYFIAELKLD